MPTTPIELFSYLPESLKRVDTDKELKHVIDAMEAAIAEVANDILIPSWDIENASRDELETMASSIGLYPRYFMSDTILRKYIRSSGRIQEFKGSDDLILYLVETLTQFKVVRIEVNGMVDRRVDVDLIKTTVGDFDTQQKILDFMLMKYARLLVTYYVTYISASGTTWRNPLRAFPKSTVLMTNIMNIVYKKPISINSTSQVSTDMDTTLRVNVSNYHRFYKPFELVNF